MASALALAAMLALSPTQAGKGGKTAAAPAPGPAAPDARLRKAWSYLLPEEQADLVARFAAEAGELATLQAQLIRRALELSQVDPGFLAEDGPTPFFDPVRHAPAQPIPRQRLEPDDARVRALHKRTFRGVPPPPFPRAWRYDWGRREVLRRAPAFTPDHEFELALSGYLPLADLAVALVEQALDRGEEQLALSAFAHAYTDREGLVYPGVTLYDAWCSGLEMEMPDVDVLGVLHSITGERGRWVAPIPAAQHDELYAEIGRLFQRAYAYRAVRDALALGYLAGEPGLPEDLEPHLPRLHGLWDETGSQPAVLAPLLPRSADLPEFIESWGLRYESDAERVGRSRERMAALEADARRARELLESLLAQSGALERKSRPKPAKKAPTKKSRAKEGG